MTPAMERQASQASYLSTTSDMAYSLSACVALSSSYLNLLSPARKLPPLTLPRNPPRLVCTTFPHHTPPSRSPSPPLPLYPTPESLAPHLSLSPDDLVPLLRHAVLFASRHADLVLLKWLFALEEPTVRFPSIFRGRSSWV